MFHSVSSEEVHCILYNDNNWSSYVAMFSDFSFSTASNIMIRMNCSCNPLYCDCTSKFQVKLGDFDSSGTIPGLHVKEPTDQLIKFASILPLGTPGYRAPEVNNIIVLYCKG